MSSSSAPPPDSSSSQSSSVAAGIRGGIAAAAVLLVVVLVVAVVVVSVCLRKRMNKHVNTTDNVAYHYSNSSDHETMKINEAYAELSGPSITTSTNDAHGITRGVNDVTTSQNEAYAVTDGVSQSSGSGMRMKTDEVYADMSTAMNEDAYTYAGAHEGRRPEGASNYA